MLAAVMLSDLSGRRHMADLSVSRNRASVVMVLTAVLRAAASAISVQRGARPVACSAACAGRFVREPLFLLGPGIGKPGHERRRGDPGRSGAVDHRGDDA